MEAIIWHIRACALANPRSAHDRKQSYSFTPEKEGMARFLYQYNSYKLESSGFAEQQNWEHYDVEYGNLAIFRNSSSLVGADFLKSGCSS